MNKSFLFLSFIVSFMIAGSQTDSWTIKLNNKVWLSTSTEDEERNTKAITKAEWNKQGTLEIKFKEGEPGQWKRSFLFYDENDEEIITKNNTSSVKIALSSLRKSYAGKKEIHIYTTKAPVDPNIAVRIRRVHLCTLRLP